MKNILFVFALLFISCNSSDSKKEKNLVKQTTETDYQVGLDFINDYLDYILNQNINSSRLEWIDNRMDVSDTFKLELRALQEEAERENPEYGLGFDPILDAQDAPNKFEIKSENGNYLIVKGTDWPDFRLTLKLLYNGESWLVDGAGVINVPKDKQARR